MLNLFLRTLILYLFLLLILRLTGKRQVADLEPFDLIVTLIVADVGSNAISDTNIPLLYSIVPIIGLYLMQQVIARACLKSDRVRHFLCGTPQLLIRGGRLDETVMRRTNYTIHDVLDHLREKDVFNLDEVEDAILETNGSMSVRLKPATQPPARPELNVSVPKEQPPALLIREGRLCPEGLAEAAIDEAALMKRLQKNGLRVADIFVLQRTTAGKLHAQVKAEKGGKVRELA